MYSVIRFSGFSTTQHLYKIGKELNRYISDMFSKPDNVADRFSCTISDDDEWTQQCLAIEKTIGLLDPLIRQVVASGVHIEVDIAIEPEDYFGRLLTSFSLNASLLKAMVEADISLELSLYGVTGT